MAEEELKLDPTGRPTQGGVDESTGEVRNFETNASGHLLSEITSQRISKTALLETDTPLAGSASFTSAVLDTTDFWTFRVVAYADVSGTLYIDESTDNTFWFQSVQSVVVGAGEVQDLSISNPLMYVRARFVNGATPQGAFDLATILSDK